MDQDTTNNILLSASLIDLARIQKVMSGGVQFLFVFLVDEGSEDPNTTISGCAMETPFKWRLAGVSMMA